MMKESTKTVKLAGRSLRWGLKVIISSNEHLSCLWLLFTKGTLGGTLVLDYCRRYRFGLMLSKTESPFRQYFNL